MAGASARRCVAAFVLGAALVLPVFVAYPAWAQSERTDAFVAELKSLIDGAERGRAADPRFLEDLRAAIGSYEMPQAVEIFSDDFRDGDISNDPQWLVIEGEFSVDRSRGLRMAVQENAAASEPADTKARRERLAELIALREAEGPYITVRSVTLPGNPRVRLASEITRLENALPPKQVDLLAARVGELERIEADTGRWTQVASTTLGSKQRAPVGEELARVRDALAKEAAISRQPQRAEILIARDIPNAFELEMNLSSAVRNGRFNADIFQGARLRSGYRLTYDPSQRPAFLLTRFGSYGARQIGAFNAAINLDDGALHNIVLTRASDASMVLTVDGKHLISIVDREFRDPFDGVTLTSERGDYTVRDIVVRGLKR